MGKKKKAKKLANRLEKLEKNFYEDIKYISKEEMLAAKLSKPVKAYYKKLPADRARAFLTYIIKQEERERLEFLDGLELRDDGDTQTDERRPKKCSSLRGVITDFKKRRKDKNNSKKKLKHAIKRKDGVLMLFNPESYDHTLLSKKKYRQYLAKLAKKQAKDVNPVLDCTLSNFKSELMSNPNINTAVTEAFFAKYHI